MLFAAMVVPALSAQRVTVDQLEQTLAANQTARDSDITIARQLRSMGLTEQLTEPTLSRLIASFKPGPDTLLALNFLADYAAFFEPPAEELPVMAPPSAAEQQSMMKSALNFVAVTLRQLPNLLATRVTRSFDDIPPVDTRSGGAPQNTRLHQAGTFTQEITYRNGRESFSHASRDGRVHKQDESLECRAAFVLVEVRQTVTSQKTVKHDHTLQIALNNLAWGRGEQTKRVRLGPAGRECLAFAA